MYLWSILCAIGPSYLEGIVVGQGTHGIVVQSTKVFGAQGTRDLAAMPLAMESPCFGQVGDAIPCASASGFWPSTFAVGEGISWLVGQQSAGSLARTTTSEVGKMSCCMRREEKRESPGISFLSRGIFLSPLLLGSRPDYCMWHAVICSNHRLTST